jgi:predicted O-methyltransferase YrrM
MNFKKQIEVAGYLLFKNKGISINWIQKKQNSVLAEKFTGKIVRPSINSKIRKIEALADATNSLGEQPLWDGYARKNENRMPDRVRTHWLMGPLYSEITRIIKPETIVEFGTAFGVSGMYWLNGLEENKKGKLYTFEPNDIWAKIADKNLSKISNRYALTHGTFEDKVDEVLKGTRIDIAFIDAIHTREFVEPQLEIVLKNCSGHSYILLDDINFSAEMKQLWDEVSNDKRFIASAALGNRVGILEYKR